MAEEPTREAPAPFSAGGGSAHDRTWNFGYTPASQIASSIGYNDAYSYPPLNESTASTVNGLNQLVTHGAAAIAHDAKGNLASDGSTSFAYDSESRLISATGTKNATLSYDPLGRLYQVTTPSGSRRFVYDGLALIAEHDGAGTLLRRHVHGPGMDEPLVTYEGGARRYFHADERGSIVAVSDDAGNNIGINRYDEYGLPRGLVAGRFGYTGQAWMPELGLWHYKARVYDPKLGRFLQPDPIGYSDGMNLYAYVGNDPVNKVDPLGLEDEEIVVIACGGGPRINGRCAEPGELDRLQSRAAVLPGPFQGPGAAVCGGSDCQEIVVVAKPRQCLASDGSIRNDAIGRLPPGNVVTGSIYAEGYVGVGGGFQVGVFLDRETGNFGIFTSFEGGVGLGFSTGGSFGFTRDLGSLVGRYRVVGGGAGPISGNLVTSAGRVIGYTAGFGSNFGWPMAVSVHSSRGLTEIRGSKLPRCR